MGLFIGRKIRARAQRLWNDNVTQFYDAEQIGL
jgi:hypothetical protein